MLLIRNENICCLKIGYSVVSRMNTTENNCVEYCRAYPMSHIGRSQWAGVILGMEQSALENTRIM